VQGWLGLHHDGGEAEAGSYALAEATAGWARGATERAQYLGLITEQMLEMAGVQRGSRVLDVAAGTGEQSIQAGLGIGPDGYVLATDVASRMHQVGFESARAERNLDGAGAELELGSCDRDAGRQIQRGRWRNLRDGRRTRCRLPTHEAHDDRAERHGGDDHAHARDDQVLLVALEKLMLPSRGVCVDGDRGCGGAESWLAAIEVGGRSSVVGIGASQSPLECVV